MLANHRVRVNRINLFFIPVPFVLIRFGIKLVVYKNLQNFLEIYHKQKNYPVRGAEVRNWWCGNANPVRVAKVRGAEPGSR